MEIIFDASTLILLAKTELLREVTDEAKIIIPEKVKAECSSKESIDALLISTLIKEKKIEVKKAGNPKAIKKIQRDFRIGPGEAEALWLARRLDCPIAVGRWSNDKGMQGDWPEIYNRDSFPVKSRLRE